MRLEIEKTTVRHLRFGLQTELQGGELTVNRDELTQLLEKDQRLDKIELAIALPGEKCRILYVVDVIEPRVKPAADGHNGHSGHDSHSGHGGYDRNDILGQGRTLALKGMAVVISDYRDESGATISTRPYGSIIDMYGPAAELSPFGRTCNLVLLATPRPDLPAGEYQIATKQAGLKAGAYLAAAACKQAPEDTLVYDLPPLPEISRSLDHLPKVIYIPQIYSLQFVPIPGEPILFGRQADGIVPTLLHPNQIMDGAVTSAYPAMHLTTYHLQNSPVVESLFKRHGRDLCFCGVIVTIAPNNVADFNIMADLVAGMAKHLVGADGAILTKCVGGAPELAMARTAQSCEQLGIKTVLAMLNIGADVKDYKYGAATIFNIPEVDAIVSMGSPYPEVTLPPVERLIGKLGEAPENSPVDGEIVRTLGMIKGAMCQMGSSRLYAVRY